ncbi:TetR family transcriptional regulator C-terminal domain-containing protein [Fulvivirga ligni]|uniref:TetR family transcriptional regulator C-terminal domain-containing protein n=1 Tax=Fulvivirga ligni TaxID=2904246 RepID=UPI001F287940|nr:TetR family transcriptional regulator C-terminal domain-containing protein [Fulvivirga ligni]UII19904.1 TetR/AcrR family transcriptional regulator [Fulvivirga ligni]
MEAKAKKTRKAAPKTNVAAKIQDAYKTHLLTHGAPPPSVFKFMQDWKMKEADFYLYYGSFATIESKIWESYIDDTVSALSKDEVYPEYSVREKLLAFYYTLIEALKQDRSFVLLSLKSLRKSPEISPAFMRGFKAKYFQFVQRMVQEGIDSEEIVKRPLISERYKDGLWLQLLFVLRFWCKDESAAFANTDAAIEKSVNLSFELMGRGPLDIMVDFAKFIYQTR